MFNIYENYFDRNYLEKNDGVMLTSQAGSLLGDMMSECHLFRIKLEIFVSKWISC